jgi:hypothetical protein
MLNQLTNWFHTCAVYGQSLHKYVGVSGSELHNLHKESLGQPLFAKLFAVRIFLCSLVQS